jgi:hypothetical protein
MKARKAMLASETEWAAAATSLYNFALLHSQAISVAGGVVHIANAAILTEFNTHLSHAGKTRVAYNASLENVKRLHQQLVDSEGLTETDMGLKK